MHNNSYHKTFQQTMNVIKRQETDSKSDVLLLILSKYGIVNQSLNMPTQNLIVDWVIISKHFCMGLVISGICLLKLMDLVIFFK